MWENPNVSSLSTPRRRKGAAEVQLHSFLTSALDTDEWSTSRPGHFTLVPIQGNTRWTPEKV